MYTTTKRLLSMNIDLHHYDYYKKMLSNDKHFEVFFSQDRYKEIFNECIDAFEDLLIDSIRELTGSLSGYVNTSKDGEFCYIISVNNNIKIHFFRTLSGLFDRAFIKILSGPSSIFSIYSYTTGYFNIDTNVKNIFRKKLPSNKTTALFLDSHAFHELFDKDFFNNAQHYLNQLRNKDFIVNLNRIIVTLHLNNIVTLENEHFDFYKFEESVDVFNLKHDIKIISYEESAKSLKLK